MSKRAEEAARDYVLTSASPFPNTETAAVIYGYTRAEKDLALTWEDIDKIDRILEKMVREDLDNHLEWYESRKNYYTEALRRFKKEKEEEQ